MLAVNSSTVAAIAMIAMSFPATAADWQVVPDESALGIIGHQNDVEFIGRFFDFDANIEFDPADPASASINVMIDMDSLDTDNPRRDDTIRGIELFYVAEFPTAEFAANGFLVEADGRYSTVGDLTIRDVTQSVTLPFTLTIEGDRAHAVGEVTVNRIDFGVGQGSWSSPNPVSHDVTITIDIVADRQE